MFSGLLRRSFGFLMLLIAIVSCWNSEATFWQFAILVVVFDCAAFGYLNAKTIGAKKNELIHSWIPPFVLLFIGSLAHDGGFLTMGYVWLAHVALDLARGCIHEGDFVAVFADKIAMVRRVI